MVERTFLLRVANVNPSNVRIHTDRVLYSAIGVFILLYFAYATVGAAAFIDATTNYTHPWWQWLVGPPVAVAVIAFDRAVVGRVAVNLANLDSQDPRHLLRRRTLGVYVGRLLLALLVAVIITEPLMLARYRPEIDAWLTRAHSEQISRSESTGAIVTYTRELAKLADQDTADDRAVDRLYELAAAKRQEAATLYAQALADSAGEGVTRRPGCPVGGYCYALVQRSRVLNEEASSLDVQAQQVRAAQETSRVARAAQKADLTAKINQQRAANVSAVTGDSGFGARTKAMWHLARDDFWGIGFFYVGVALLLVVLDCAAVGLKLISHGNAYERAEARDARRLEHEAMARHDHDLRITRATADAYAEATLDIVTNGIRTAGQEQVLFDTATDHARARLADAVADDLDPDHVHLHEPLTTHG
jgi:hypothetical protein